MTLNKAFTEVCKVKEFINVMYVIVNFEHQLTRIFFKQS